MKPVSIRTKRPRVEPGDTGVSTANGRSKPQRASPDSVADAKTWSAGEEDAKSESSEESEWSGGKEDAKSESSEESGGEEDAKSESSEESECSNGEEDAQSEVSVETDRPAVTVLDWSDTTPAEPQTIEVRVPRRTWCWLQTWTLKDVKAMRPCDKKWTKEDQRQLLANLKRVLAQPTRVDGDWIYVTEQYSAPKKTGFPGRLMSSGLQGLQGQIRANLLAGTADIDMSACMHRILLWVCKQFNIATPQLKWYVRNRDGPNGMLQRVMDEASVSKGKAKELFTMAYTSVKPIRVSSPCFKKLDEEAKEIQKKLMQRLELQWIVPFCKEDNRPGSFIAHLFQWIECKLVVPVSRVVSAEFNTPIAALVFDGFNVANGSLHGEQAVLDRAHAACEQICPGIDMRWAWKELDFMVKSKDTRAPLEELRVPDSFVAPVCPQWRACWRSVLVL